MWIDEFLSLLTDSTITHGAVDRAYELKDGNLPSKLYKFRAINEFSISNFENDTVWLCSADKYNDPYECATTWSAQEVLRQHTKSNIEDLIVHAKLEKHLSRVELSEVRASHDPMIALSKILIGRHESISPEKRDEMIAVLIEASNRIFAENIHRMSNRTQRGMKICSFSSRLDSIVMWGHYANSHTGFAMEYDVTTWPPGDIRRRILHPVIYKQRLFDATKYHLQAIEKGGGNNLFGAIASIHKSPDWSYENEWRFVLPMGESFVDQNYPIPTPSAVYIGPRVSAENKNLIMEIAKKKSVPVREMSLSPIEFRMIPNPIGETLRG